MGNVTLVFTATLRKTSCLFYNYGKNNFSLRCNSKEHKTSLFLIMANKILPYFVTIRNIIQAHFQLLEMQLELILKL